uniref:hypothetical protein n=1 Tax=Nocardia suismassiliense TaxID=2077092 RepID=UPI003F49489C
MSMKTVGAVVAVAVASAVLAGCGTSSQSAAPPSSSVPSSTTTAAAVSSTSNATAPLAPGAEITIGDNGGAISLRITMFSVTQQAAPTAPTPPSGGHWAAVDAQTCVDKSDIPITVGWDTWAVADAKYGNYPSSNLTYNQFPKPLYPFGTQGVAVGDCVRGAILFPVPDDVVITRVKYQPNPKVNASWSAN